MLPMCSSLSVDAGSVACHQVGSPREILERSTLMRSVPFKRTPLIGRRTLIWCLACCVNVLMAPAAAAQDGRFEIEYTVKVADIPGQLFHVSTDIKNINQPALELSLPVW